MKTKTISQNDIKEKWYLIDAGGARVGRIATIAAELLQGKNSVLTKDYLDPKVHVVVINTKKIDFTAKRGFAKFFKRYSGYPGGLKFESFERKFAKDPNFPIVNAVKGMLPKTKLADKLITHLKVYSGAEHVHEAQKPEKIDLKKYRI